MKILYFGSDSFGITCMDRLSREHEIAAIITAPDKPRGRGLKVSPNEVKKWAESRHIKVYQPAVFDSFFTGEFENIAPDIIVLISYGKKLPGNILELPLITSINVHPSLLPAYRGAAPMEWTLINGERTTGVTLITMSREIDRGNILAQKSIPVEEDDDIFTLREKLSLLSSEMLAEVIEDISAGRLRTTPQKGVPSYTRKLTKADGLIDWRKPAAEINNIIRGTKEWPGAHTYLKDRHLKIFRAFPVKKEGEREGAKPGEILDTGDRDSINVACGEGILKITEVQMEGKRRMAASEFLRGCKIEAGTLLAGKRDFANG